MQRFLLTTSIIAIIAAPAAADDIQLGQILVTEGRTPIEAERSGRAFTIITGAELEASQTRYVADALRKVPGFHVSRAGSLGGFTQVRVRGAEGNHLLVLIDGVEVGAANDGEYDFGGLQVADIDRIEVLRGPQSAFWGSNAMAGVVNIITKGGIRNGFEVSGRTEGGTDGTARLGATIRGGTDVFDAAFSADVRRTDGFNISSFGTEKDGDHNLTANGKASWEITPFFTLDGTFRVVDRESEDDAQDFAFPPTPTQGLVIDTDRETKTDELFGSITGTWTLFDGFIEQRFGIKAGDTSRDNFADGLVTSGNEGNRFNAFYQATAMVATPALANSEHRFTGGYDFEREEFRQRPPVRNPSQLDTQSRDINAVIAEYRGAFDERVFLNAAVRHDQNDRFEDATTYSVSGAVLIPETGTRLHASVGTGVTNPSFFEQFGFVPAQFIGNPNLSPESAFGWDIGIEQAFFDDLLVVDVTYFNQDLQDEIQTNFVGGGLTPVNLTGTSERQGIEVAASVTLFDQASASATYTYTDATEPNGAVEVRRPEHAASLFVEYAFLEDRARVFLDLIYNGEMEDLEFINATPRTRVTLDSYTVVNIGGRYDINDNVEVFGRVENLFDEDYEEVFGFNTQGVTAFAGIKGTFGVDGAGGTQP